MQDRSFKRCARASSDGWLSARRHSDARFTIDDVRLLPVWPKDLRDRTLAGRRKLISIIERELRKERQRGIAGARTYDVARHAKLVRLLKEERRSFLTLVCSGAVSNGRRAPTDGNPNK